MGENKKLEIYKIACKAHSELVKKHSLNSACYLLSFFIYKYCKDVLGVRLSIVVGWVNDGTWDGVSSHAWVEYEGKKIDISLSETADPNISPTGDAVVMDEVIDRGTATYTYHYDIPEKATIAYAVLLESATPQILQFIRSKEQEHKIMDQISKSDALIDQYFDNAPESRQFTFLKSMLEVV